MVLPHIKGQLALPNINVAFHSGQERPPNNVLGAGIFSCIEYHKVHMHIVPALIGTSSKILKRVLHRTVR